MGQVDQKQVDAWKAEHKDVFLIIAGDKTAYLRKPTRAELSYATASGKEDPTLFNETIMKQCWLGGDDEIVTDAGLFLSASAKLTEVIGIVEAELVKL